MVCLDNKKVEQDRDEEQDRRRNLRLDNSCPSPLDPLAREEIAALGKTISRLTDRAIKLEEEKCNCKGRCPDVLVSP